MPRTRRGDDRASTPPKQTVLTRPAPQEPGKFTRARMVGDYVILEWTTAYGDVGLAHSLRLASSSARRLAEAVYDQFREHMHTVYAALVTPQTQANLGDAPELEAIDLYPERRLSEPYEVTWRQLAAVLGARPPWFHPALRDRDTIMAWKPGDAPAIVPASDVEMPALALLELAVDEPDGSPAAAVCLWLARHLRRLDTKYARQSIDEIRAEARNPESDCAYVHIAAVPAPLLREENTEPDEMTHRAGWAQIVERRDVLAAAAAAVAARWDGGKAWPVGQIAQFDPTSSPVAAEWASHLHPAPVGQPPTVLERRLLDQGHSIDRTELLHDDASGCPAIRRTDHMGNVTMYACMPQRIGTVAPLSEVILSRQTVWIRTSDGGLWLAPSLPGRGLSWGYSGSGPIALSEFLDRLLDDITSPPVSDYNEPPAGLLSLIKATPKDGTTTYNRAQLLAARAG